MKLTRSLLCTAIVVLAVLFNSCSPKVEITSSWVNKKELRPTPYKSVFIIVLSGNYEFKKAIEANLATAAEARGIKAFTSMSAFGPFSGKESIPSKELITKKVETLGAEAIFTVALRDKEIKTEYVPGSTTVYASYPSYGYYGSFADYYDYNSAVFYSPGYYKTDKTYFVESNLYDAKTQLMIMSVQTKAVNPETVEKSSLQFTSSLVDELARLRAEK